jgi:valyl-tRNA synthetase
MFGDVCLVVNPKDERFLSYVGKYFINPANGDKLPLITDESVDIKFGTGVMKCTPAHDATDFGVAKRHNLAMPLCLNKDGTINKLGGKYEGLERFAARKQLVEDIKAQGDLIKIEKITHNVGFSERSNVIVEPYLSKQWFVKMAPLAKALLKYQ